MDLAQMNRAHLPRWMNLGIYILAEAAIICTDIGQVSLHALCSFELLELKNCR